MAPRPPPITPAMTVLPTQLSMPACICEGGGRGQRCWVSAACGEAWGGERRGRTALTICCSWSDMPALGFMLGIAPGLLGKAMVGDGCVVGCGVRERGRRVCEATQAANFCGCAEFARRSSLGTGDVQTSPAAS
jgi:hypothetical protein